MTKVSMYDVKRCVRGECDDVDVWNRILKTPNADQLWENAEQLVKEEDYLDFVLITDSFLRSAIHQHIHRFAQQTITVTPPVLREDVQQFQYLLRTMSNGTLYPLLWKTIRVHKIPNDTIIHFPHEYFIQAPTY
jgi:hypothetical protein